MNFSCIYIYILRWYHRKSFILHRKIIDTGRFKQCQLSASLKETFCVNSLSQLIVALFIYIVYSDRCEKVMTTITKDCCDINIRLWHLCMYMDDMSHLDKLLFFINSNYLQNLSLSISSTHCSDKNNVISYNLKVSLFSWRREILMFIVVIRVLTMKANVLNEIDY
jgi:hypothetical protein